jgi:hypothetical protein
MLSPETPFPYVGSYALYCDPDAEPPQADELVRINWRREGFAMVSFPLRDGASGNKTVPFADLIDATPLSSEEAREFHDLDRALFGRVDGAVGKDGRRTRLSAKQKREAARRDALRRRTIYAPLLERLLRKARAKVERRAA